MPATSLPDASISLISSFVKPNLVFVSFLRRFNAVLLVIPYRYSLMPHSFVTSILCLAIHSATKASETVSSISSFEYSRSIERHMVLTALPYLLIIFSIAFEASLSSKRSISFSSLLSTSTLTTPLLYFLRPSYYYWHIMVKIPHFFQIIINNFFLTPPKKGQQTC